MDLLDCQNGSRCDACHHMTARGCALALALDGAFDRPRAAREPGLIKLNLWGGRSGEVAES